METLRNKRGIVDRAALEEAVTAVLDDVTGDSERQTAMLEVYRAALEAGTAEIRRRFDGDRNGALAVQGHCFLIDQLLRVLYDVVSTHLYPVGNPTAADHLSIVATGGYGRGELAPKSDVDLLFLLPYKQTPRGEQIVEQMLYTLWDLGLKVGHATRSVDDCIRQAKADMTIRTGLLESRYVWGEQDLYRELRQRFLTEAVKGKGDFIEAKLAERDARHKRMGDTRYVLEPNIKDGKGGLRDLHTLFWIAKYLYRSDDIGKLVEEKVFTKREVARFDKAQRFLWTVRCHLHYVTGRAEDRLTFDVQAELAERNGYKDRPGTSGVERFMKHYFLVAKDVGDLTRILCASMEARHQRKPMFGLPSFGLFDREVEGFPVDSGRLNVPTPEHFADTPVDMLRLFEVSQRSGLDVHPDALSLITRNLRRIDNEMRVDPEANRIFMSLLTSHDDPEVTLRHMNEAGVFGRFVTDFGRVVAQMQYDMYHVYTTDEHTIRAIGILNKIERGVLQEDHPLSTEVIQFVLSREVLYVAILLHDIAKGRGGNHSVLGAEIAENLCPRLGMTAEQTESVAWLVLHHLAMSDTAFKRDLSDPKTILDFAELVQSPERLRLLLCLTVADIRAVGPEVWNGWKASLLRELYYRTESVLTGGLVTEGRDALVAAAEDELRQELADWDDAAFARHLELGQPSYWLSFDAETLGRQARFIRAAEESGQELSIEKRVDMGRAVTEVTIYTGDHPGLFSAITGGIAVSGANIVDARINTLNNGMALDTFWLQDAEGEAIERPDKLARLVGNIERSLYGKLRPRVELANRAGLPSRTRVFKVPPRVLIDNKASDTHTVIEVNSRDRPGLLYEVTRALSQLSLQIASAKISTYGEQVVDVFYVTDVFATKVLHEDKQKRIEEVLLAALADPGCAPEKPAADAAADAAAPKDSEEAAAE